MEKKFISGVKYLWNIPANRSSKAITLAEKWNLSVPVIQTLINRGYKKAENIHDFLFLDKKSDISHPSMLKDSQKTTERLIRAIKNHEKILICGDYDADGITASSLILACLLPLKASINFFLPNREEGYGLSEQIVEKAAKNGYKLIITVDNGITAFKAGIKAANLGIDLIITDHHKPLKVIPQAYTIVNPQQKECKYPFKNLAGVGVAFKLMSLLYEELGLKIPEKIYDLLLLGTVADLVPLVGENRFWVRHCLNLTKKNESPVLKALKKGAKINKEFISSSDISFFLAPQINALGRFKSPRDGVKFFLTSDQNEIDEIGNLLSNLNEKRKDIERSIVEKIEKKLEKRDNLAKKFIITESDENWPLGIMGIAASKIVEKYNRPTFLFKILSNGIAKGSGRSIKNFDLFKALEKVKDLLISFGGHTGAAGLSLKTDKIEKFEERMSEIISDKLTIQDLQPKINLDAEVNLIDTSKKLMSDLNYLEPFGAENPAPIFLFRELSIVGKPKIFKGAHVKCMVFSEGVVKPVIFFNRPEMYEILMNRVGEDSHGKICNLAAQIMENNWGNKTQVELQGKDLEICT